MRTALSATPPFNLSPEHTPQSLACQLAASGAVAQEAVPVSVFVRMRRPSIRERRISFSAARYSLRNSSPFSTWPLTNVIAYAASIPVSPFDLRATRNPGAYRRDVVPSSDIGQRARAIAPTHVLATACEGSAEVCEG